MPSCLVSALGQEAASFSFCVFPHLKHVYFSGHLMTSWLTYFIHRKDQRSGFSEHRVHILFTFEVGRMPSLGPIVGLGLTTLGSDLS